MKKIVRKAFYIKKETGAVLAVSLQMIALTLISLIVGVGGDNQPNRVDPAQSEQIALPLPNGVASVSTDKAIYVTGEGVTIIASGFSPNEAVALHIDASDGGVPWDGFAVPDAAGSFSNAQFVIENKGLNVVFTLTAKGLSSGLTAATTFTSSGGDAPWPAPPASPTPTPCALGTFGNAGGFQIDADFFSNTDACGTGGTRDWAGPMGVLLESGGNVIIPAAGSASYNPATNAAFVRDHVWCGSDVDLTTFTGGEKNDQAIDAASTHWATTTGSGPQKNDLTNVYVYAPRPSVSTDGHQWLILGAERRSTGGDSYVDFEYNQAGIVFTPPSGNENGSLKGNGPVAGRSVGDILVVTNFANGGGAPGVEVRSWLATGAWSDPEAPSPGAVFVVVNPADIPAVAPGAGYVPDNSCTSSDTTSALQFVEAAVDLTALSIPGFSPCTVSATVNVKSRSSDSFTSDLKDFVLFNFVIAPPAPCDITGPKGPVCPSTPDLKFCAPAGAASYSWSITGNGTITGPTDGQCVTVTAGTDCNTSFTLMVTTTNADGCENACSTVIMVQDKVAPTIGGQGANATIECTATPTFTAPTASDNCGATTVQQVSDTTAAGTCVNNFSRTVTWRAADACGNTSGTVIQTITVRDTTPPTIGGQGANATIECTATPVFAPPTASDACGGSTVQNLGDTTTAGTCANNRAVARSWRAVDACSNTSGTVTQTITVRDTTPPVIGNAGANATIECTATPSFTAPTASDACGTSTVVLDSDTTAAGSCANNFSRTRTWHAVDACGNTSAPRTQTITVVDTTPPVIGNAGANGTIECTATPSFTAPTASDACGTSTVVLDSDTTAAGSCANNFTRTRTWHAVDACGNTSAPRTQTITVVDTTPPVIGNAGANGTIECTATPSFTAPTASDACGTSTVVLDSDTTAAGSCANNFTRTRTWHAVDACGNTSATRTQTITVRDTTPPVIGNAGANATIECTATPSFTAPTASDACGTSTVVLDSDTTAAGSCANNFSRTRTWHAVDACGNTSAPRTQTITVVDTTPPVIGNAGANGTIECTATPSFTAPTASDACGTSTVVLDSDTTAAGSCANNFTRTRTWHAVDACGNTSAPRTQTITVVDTTPPVIGNAGANGTIECTATPSFTAPTASDACGTSTVVLDSDTTAAGSCANNFTRTRTWHAVDACGNTSAPRTQTITVVDTTPPVIGNAGANGTIECTATPSFTAPTASDACGTSTVVLDSDTTAAGSCANNFTRTRTWHAVDACGNTSAPRTQTITVRDTTPPVIGNAGANGTIECTATPSFTAPTASDACGTSTVVLDSDTTAAGSCANNFSRTRTWHAVDACGNTSAPRTQTITVVDTTPPVIGAAGANGTIECTATPSFTAPTASDACGTSTVVLDSDTTAAGSCANNFSRTRTWHAVDACGNTSAPRTQTITVVDTTPPVIGNAGANATIECTATPSFTAPTASDACGTSTVVLDSDTTAAGSCANNFSRTRTWHAVDACGNTSVTRTQTITVRDTTPPVIGNAGANATIECPATPVFSPPTASDACGGSTVNLVSDTTAAGSCANNYTRTRTWDATDACGNHSATRSQTITVVDTTPPMLSGCPGGDVSGVVQCYSDVPPPPTVTANDVCQGPIPVMFNETQSNPGSSCNNTITRTWTATDNCGNSASCMQMIVVNDTTPPVIGPAGPDATIECTGTQSFTAPTASDNCGGATVQMTSDTTVPGTGNVNFVHTKCWRAVDACGNTSGTVCQSITVLTCPCTAISSITSNFNGTSISPSNYIWFNANFKTSGQVQDGTMILLTMSTIHIVSSNGTSYDVTVPNAKITFSASATCASTTFTGGQWVTTVPLSGSDEIFLSGLLIKVSDITGSSTVDLKSSTVTWTGNFSATTTGVNVSWKWGAAVYQPKNASDNLLAMAAANPILLGVRPTHTNACGFNGSDHAGTPVNIKNRVVGGARGGGGSNFTGSWSGTQTVAPCVPSGPGAPGDSTVGVEATTVLPAFNVCPPTPGTRLRALTMTYEGRNVGGGTITGNPNGLDTAYIVATGGSSDLFVGLVTFNSRTDPDSAYFVIDAGTAGTLPDQVTVEIHKGQTRTSALVSTVTFDTSCNQPINQGDYFGSLRVSDGSQ